MGLFKNAKNATGMIANAKQMQADAMQAQADANKPVDSNDPAFAPVHGVTLDRYAELMRGMASEGLVGPDQVNAWMTSQGVPEGMWPEVNTEWSSRMATNTQVRTRFGMIYSQG